MKFCEKCLHDVDVVYQEKEVKEVIDHQEICYMDQYYVCCSCGQKIYDDLLDQHIDTINEALRKQNHLISVSEIESILKKYQIGKKNLSIVLGLGEITVTRYLDGSNPTRENSDLLYAVLENPYLYELFLIAARDKITDIAYRKSMGSVKQLELTSEHSKLYQVALFVVECFDEITPLVLQKILYFIKGFSKPLLGESIFSDVPEAWIHGPVYKDIYACFSYFKREKIDYFKILKDYEYDLTDEEKIYVAKITLLFGCYGGSVLREMTHLTTPWIDARGNLKEEEYSMQKIEDNMLFSYFEQVCQEYHIETVEDVQSYSTTLFQEALLNLER